MCDTASTVMGIVAIFLGVLIGWAFGAIPAYSQGVRHGQEKERGDQQIEEAFRKVETALAERDARTRG